MIYGETINLPHFFDFHAQKDVSELRSLLVPLISDRIPSCLSRILSCLSLGTSTNKGDINLEAWCFICGNIMPYKNEQSFYTQREY